MEEEDSLLEPFSELVLPSESPIGRVMNTLLGSPSRRLEAAISRVGLAPSKSSSGALLDESLCFLWRHVEDAIKKEKPLDEVLVPMIQHSLMCARYKKSMPNLLLLQWLISHDMLSHALLSRLLEAIRKRDDHYVALGWCILVGKLIEDIRMPSLEKGQQEEKVALLKTLCQSIPDLTSIICSGSKQNGEFELPTRLCVAAANCVMILTEALAKWTTAPEAEDTEEKTTGSRIINYQLVSVSNIKSEEKNMHKNHHQVLTIMDAGEAVWGEINNLIVIVQKLQAWSKKSQPLHAKGLEQVWKWLHEIKVHYSPPIPNTGSNLLREGILLLCSYWKQYANLLRLDASSFVQNHKEMLMQFMSAIQYYTERQTLDSGNSDNTSNAKTRLFFLNCIALLWGRLQGKYLEIALAEHGHQLLSLLFNQLHCKDENLIEGSVSILRSIILENISSRVSASQNISQMESVLPLLLDLLDERDSTSPAIFQLTAECCYVYPEGGLEELFRRLKEGHHQHKKNIIAIILKLVRLDSGTALPASIRWNISKCMLDCLADKELADCLEVAELFPHLDYSAIFPGLVHLVYSEEEKISSTASKALVVTLQCHSDKFDIMSMILDSLSKLPEMSSQNSSPGKIDSKGSAVLPTECKRDIDRIFCLILRKETIQNWRLLIEKLILKMFAEPSNTVLVRFMSKISEHLAENVDLVFSSLLVYLQRLSDLDQRSLSNNSDGSSNTKDILETENTLYNRLCPLLLIRVLPLHVFDDLQKYEMYGDLCIGDNRTQCIASHLVRRAFNFLEYDDVRKLATELCGRLHPQVLYPDFVERLKNAVSVQDLLAIKACLFTICTSLVVRRIDHVVQKEMHEIRRAIDIVLSWPSTDSSEVSKAQHGCIDCLALMICNEMKILATPNCSGSLVFSKKKDDQNIRFIDENKSSVLADVIQKLTRNKIDHNLYKNASVPIRLCMANVLISACQKLPDSKKNEFACRTISKLVSRFQDILVSEVRAACLQVLFSAVYHLRSYVLPFASDLLKLSIIVLRNGSEKERLSAAKLMGALMASEDEIVLAISSGLFEARAVLVQNSSQVAVPELRDLCRQLLSCITTP